MERNSVTAVWLEAQVDENGIALSLISEGTSSGAVVEEIEHFTLEELAEMDGEIFSLTLSDNARDTLSEMSRLADIGRVLEDGQPEEQSGIGQSENDNSLPEEGDVLNDPESNARFGDGRVKVTNVTNTQALNYNIIVKGQETTVARQNPGHPSDAIVVEGEYVEGSSKTYAFPVTRLE
jgi:hypothetical protein